MNHTINAHLTKPLFRHGIAILAAAIFCIAATGCKPKPQGPQGPNILATTVAGREIRAVIDGPCFLEPGPPTTISARSNKIVVERERVLLDGIELAKLPATATKVEVTVAGKQLTVSADGVTATTKQLSK